MDYSGSGQDLAVTGTAITVFGATFDSMQIGLVGAAVVLVGIVAIVIRTRFRRDKQATEE